jgi:hypothetical protein
MSEFKSQADVWRALIDGRTVKRIDRKYRIYKDRVQHSDIDLNNWEDLNSVFDPFMDFSTYNEPNSKTTTMKMAPALYRVNGEVVRISKRVFKSEDEARGTVHGYATEFLAWLINTPYTVEVKDE